MLTTDPALVAATAPLIVLSAYALIADGESRVWQIDYVERGYEALRENLLALGAEVSEGQALPPNALASAFERGAEVRAGSALSPA